MGALSADGFGSHRRADPRAPGHPASPAPRVVTGCRWIDKNTSHDCRFVRDWLADTPDSNMRRVVARRQDKNGHRLVLMLLEPVNTLHPSRKLLLCG